MTDRDREALEWRPIESAPEGTVVRTKIHDEHGSRNDQSLKRQGRLWFFPDSSMYVYYRPTHWMPLPAPPEGEEGGEHG